MNIFRAREKSFLLDRTYVMGILNVTPDSFSDGGRYFSGSDAVEHGMKMEREGADIIDIGGQSTRPGAERISAEEEWARLEKPLFELAKRLGCAISVDTFYPEVAQRAVEAGADIINDVSGAGEAMLKAAAKSGAGLIIMHPGAEGKNSPEEVKSFFEEKAAQAESFGIEKSRLCFDPGIGFGTSREEDIALIAQVEKTRLAGAAFLMALSRKRVIGEVLDGLGADERIWGTIAADTLAVAGGADFIRVHDVRAAVCAARLTDKILAARGRGLG